MSIRHPGNIVIDVMDTDYIEAGLRKLEQYKQWEKYKCAELLEELAKAAVAAAETVYASESVSVSWNFESPTVVAITAGGTDQIAFIEFGAGVYADPGHALADESKLGFQVYPGSWSESPEGVGTYPEWVRNGRQGEYKYNRVPRSGLLAAYNAIIREFTSIAHKVFEA